MPSRRPALILAAFSLAAAAVAAAPARGEEYHCRRDDLVRRVEVQFADDADRLPCQVVYWRDTERPGEKQIPWHARNQVEFCTRQAQEMVERLQSTGWSCAREEPPVEDAAALDVPSPAPEPLRADRPADATEPGSEPGAEAPQPPASEMTEAGSDPGAELPQPAASETTELGSDPAAGPTQPADALLQEALARDIRRLNELTGAPSWQLEPDTAALGDLDGDGVADGAVLLSHRDDNGGVSHHLLAYLFDGATFWPVARVNLESYYQNFRDVAVADIGERGIELLLHTPRAGDPACCPSGRRRATFELRDGELVLAAESDSGA